MGAGNAMMLYDVMGMVFGVEDGNGVVSGDGAGNENVAETEEDGIEVGDEMAAGDGDGFARQSRLGDGFLVLPPASL